MIGSSADSAGVEAHQQAFGYGTHRVVDPADQPRDLTGLAWCVYVSFGLLALLVVLRILGAIHLHGLVSGGGNIEGGYRAYSRWVGFYSLLLLVSAGLFIAWFFQAYKNLRRLGVANMRYGNGWAIGAWFVPILGLWRPKQIANDIWRGSEPGAEASSGWRAVPVPSFVHWWWGLFLAQGFLLYFGQQTTRSGYNRLRGFGGLTEGFSQIKTGTTVDIIGGLIALAGIMVAIQVVIRVTEREEQLRAVTPGPAYYPPPPALAQSAPPPPQPAAQPEAEQRIQCPDCAEWIQAQANVCRFCGHRLRPLGQ